jgi:FkbM family methyltransferase
MKHTLKAFAAHLPKRWQQELKRRYFASMIRRRRFATNELEYALLDGLVSPGDWVLDIGANIGAYTLRLSELAGADGRVIAFEPVPDTFELLAANTALLQSKNVTLINAAASDKAGVVGMTIPKFESGLDNFYMAHLSEQTLGLRVLCVTVDSLALPHPIRLAKIDAEGHELSVLKGMSGILRRDKPHLIVEDNSEDVLPYLIAFGYSSSKIEGSSNRMFRCGP